MYGNYGVLTFMFNFELRNVVDISCSVSAPNGGDIIEQVIGRLIFGLV